MAEAKWVPHEITMEATMDADTKKMALRMVPYGIYVLTAKGSDGSIAAAPIGGRPDDAILHMPKLGDNVFYGG